MDLRFRIFPVGPDKRPLYRGWQERATNDASEIQRQIQDGVRAWGIPTGAANNLFVIDLDVNKETGARVGELSLRQKPVLAHYANKADVRTPSGGAHLYFQHFDGAKNTCAKIGERIDTRGEGGYVLAPGSIIEAGEYVGTIPLTLPPVPLGLRAMLLQKPRPAEQPKRAQFDSYTGQGEIEEILSYVPADLPYQDWVNVLMALHHKFGGSDQGLAIADAWSATGAKYRPGEVAAKWKGFKGSGVTWRTVPAIARQHGANLHAIARRHAWS